MELPLDFQSLRSAREPYLLNKTQRRVVCCLQVPHASLGISGDPDLYRTALTLTNEVHIRFHVQTLDRTPSSLQCLRLTM